MTRRINSKQPMVVHPEQSIILKNKVIGIHPIKEEMMPEDSKKPVSKAAKGDTKKKPKQTRPKGRQQGKK